MQIEWAMSMPGGGTHRVGPGQFTDDSELALCLAQGDVLRSITLLTHNFFLPFILIFHVLLSDYIQALVLLVVMLNKELICIAKEQL